MDLNLSPSRKRGHDALFLDEVDRSQKRPRYLRVVKQANELDIRNGQLTRECMRELENEKRRLDAEATQDVPVQMLPASFRVRKWSRVIQPLDQSKMYSKNEKPMEIPMWIPEANIPPLPPSSKNIRSGTPALQEAYKALLVAKKKIMQSTAVGGSTTRTRNKASGSTLMTLTEGRTTSQRRESAGTAQVKQMQQPLLRSPRAEDIDDVDDEILEDEVGNLDQKESDDELEEDEEEEEEDNDGDDNELHDVDEGEEEEEEKAEEEKEMEEGKSPK